MTVQEKLSALRSEMQKRGIDAYIIPSDDDHASEYVGEHYKLREYLSGFTGSAGTLVVTKNTAALWTDSRYFIQAEAQLQNSSILLMKAGLENTPSIVSFLRDGLEDRATVGYDARVITAAYAKELRNQLSDKQISFYGEEDLGGLIWPDRPPVSKKTVWLLPQEITGLNRRDKLELVRKKMAERGSDLLLVSELSEIAWLTNLRGDDVACTPVFLSFLLLTPSNATLFCFEEAFSQEIISDLNADGLLVAPYETFYDTAKSMAEGKSVWTDESTTNERLMCVLHGAANLITDESPIALMKAIKTSAEQEGMIRAHVHDGIAVTRFIHWLQTAVLSETVTELSASEKLLQFRKEQAGFIGPSFDSIIAYGPHGAIVHYEPTEETNCTMKARGFCLTDTGGHYTDGTTDITRTIPLGPLTDEEKKAYTIVLKGHLNLGAAVFPYGLSGQNLDYLAHEALWAHGYDFFHGTGHGVGFLLSVHEGPQRIHWSRGKRAPVPFEDGMVTSNEPGLYLEGKFGIRHENLILCKKLRKTDFGQFMHFQPLTMVPFDKNAIDLSLFEDRDYLHLNAYHQLVWETLEPYFHGSERDWLKKATSPLTPPVQNKY